MTKRRRPCPCGVRLPRWLAKYAAEWHQQPRCPECGLHFGAKRHRSDRKFCSDRCKQAAYNRRRRAHQPPPSMLDQIVKRQHYKEGWDTRRVNPRNRGKGYRDRPPEYYMVGVPWYAILRGAPEHWREGALRLMRSGHAGMERNYLAPYTRRGRREIVKCVSGQPHLDWREIEATCRKRRSPSPYLELAVTTTSEGHHT